MSFTTNNNLDSFNSQQFPNEFHAHKKLSLEGVPVISPAGLTKLPG
jgi:hypothetical protein